MLPRTSYLPLGSVSEIARKWCGLSQWYLFSSLFLNCLMMSLTSIHPLMSISRSNFSGAWRRMRASLLAMLFLSPVLMMNFPSSLQAGHSGSSEKYPWTLHSRIMAVRESPLINTHRSRPRLNR